MPDALAHDPRRLTFPALARQTPKVRGRWITAPRTRRKIHLDYNAAGSVAGLPRTVFCKASQDLANRIVLGLSGGARGEALFYNMIRPLLNIEAPKGYYAMVDPATYNSMIMLGDLSNDVLTFCDHATPMTRARAESQMRLLGRLHGACYGDAVLRAKLPHFNSWLGFFTNTLDFGMREGSEAGFLAAEEVIPPRLHRRYLEVWPAAVAAVKSADALPATLVHGDVRLKNWYVAGKGEMGLGDWQCVTRGHWGRDVAYTISTALKVEDRRSWERDLLRYYLDQLASAGGPAVSFDEAWPIYRRQLNSALTWWTVTLAPPPDIPDMQPSDVTLAFIRRIAIAMDDLDALDA